MNIFLSLRSAASGLNIEPTSASRWLATLGIPENGRNDHQFKLDHSMVVTLALCSKLSSVKALDFGDAGIWHLLKLVLRGDAETDLRQAIVAVSAIQTDSVKRLKVALTGSDELVLQNRDTVDGRVKWEPQGLIQRWAGEGVLSTFSLAPLYRVVDDLFARQEKESAKAELTV